jgi:hypothetical protein
MHIVKVISVFGLVLLSSCASFRGGGDTADGSDTLQVEEALAVTSTEAESRAELLRQVQGHIDKAEAAGKNEEDRVIRKRPYFYKEYSDYTSGADNAVVTMTETESRTSPYIADVQLERVRYATRLHRGRDEARIDDHYLRDTGTETLTYELRNGRWVRVGSFFLSESTEEQVNGAWVPVQHAQERTVQPEEPKTGWFGRTISAITGG